MGLDRSPLEVDVDVGDRTRIVVGDVLEIDPLELQGELDGFDVILSDMAPDTTGIGFTDQARSAELFMRALAIARQVGKPGSAFVGKTVYGTRLR